MKANYPNLELLEYKVKELLLQDKGFLAGVEAYKQEHNTKYASFDFDTIMFHQLWGSTSTGFDVSKDGSPTLGGCAMTKAYTTVFHETLTDSYVVCFGNQPCYKVTNPGEDFLNDLKQHTLAGLKQAKERY